MVNPPAQPETNGDAPEDDPLVDACLEDALTPYLGALSPEEIEHYRRFLTAFITTHPAAVPLHERLRKRPVRASSGEVAREGVAVDDDAEAQRDGTFGKGR